MLKYKFENLPPDDKEVFRIIAERDCDRAAYLWDELKSFLKKTKGKISYGTMTGHLNNIVCPNTI